MSLFMKNVPRYIHTCSHDFKVSRNILYSYFLVNMDYKPSSGKIASQVGHASQMLTENYKDDPIWDMYKMFKSPKIILKVKNIYQMNGILNKTLHLNRVLVIDKGHTQCTPNTLTVVGYGPMEKEAVPYCIRKLRLL